MKATHAPTPNGHAPATAVRPPRKPAKPATPRQPHNLLEAIVYAASDPSIDIAKVEHLIRLRREMEAAEAGRLFNAAMVACQTELQPVARNQANTSTNSRYADLAQLAEKALPVIHKHGFALTFGETAAPKPDHIGVAVRIGHSEGHVERSEFHVPVDVAGFKGTPNKTAIHGWGSALTYCRRYALLCAFNVIVAGDDDGNAAGAKPASSAALKRSGIWGTFEAEMRGAQSLQALEAVCDRWRPRMANWSPGYKTGAAELKGQCIEALGGTLAQLQETARQLDDDRGERLYEAWQQDKRNW